MTNLIRIAAAAYWCARARTQFFIRGVRWPRKLSVLGPMGLSARGRISIGDNVTIINDSKYNRAGISHPTQLVAGVGAKLSIGSHTGISGASIYAIKQIDVGNHVLIGANCHIYDNDFHPMDWKQRRSDGQPAAAPVKIGDDVWLCANVIVLKGVSIGPRTVVAAGSVVLNDLLSLIHI